MAQPNIWNGQDALLHPPQTHQPQLDDDIQTAKKIVSFSITLIMIVSLAYAGFVLFDGDALTGYRPGDAALDSQRVYEDLIQADQGKVFFDQEDSAALNKAQKRDIKVAMSNTFGFGGHNACVLFKKIEN